MSTVSTTGRRCGRLLAALAAVFAVLAAWPASAATGYALLVGVSDYPGLAPHHALRGPANDVRLILDFMETNEALGFRRENVTVLADGVEGADGLPTLEAIGAALETLGKRVGQGDLVYLHLSGHGSRQAARNPALEADRLDEVFLPADTGEAVEGIYPNALVDDDLGRAVDAIRAAGAFVWIVLDSCHSATATRSATTGSGAMVERMLPDAAQPADASRPGPDELPIPISTQEPGWGGLAAFFAAQTIEPTPEMPLPRHRDGAGIYGLFTYTLYEAMARKPGLTYRELAQAITHAYAVGGFDRPMPLFEGDLDRPVFAHEAGGGTVLQWPLQVVQGAGRLPAGQLHGLDRDAVLAILADPLAPVEKAIGYVRVHSAGPVISRVTPIAHEGMARPDLGSLPAGAVARPVDMPLSFELALHVPEADARLREARSEVLTAIAGLAQDDTIPLNLRLVEAEEDADLVLPVASERALYADAAADETPRLWFLPADGRLSSDPRLKPHSIGLGPGRGLAPEALLQLRENLAAAFRAASLSRLSALSQLDAAGLDIALSLVRADGDTVPISGAGVPVAFPGDIVAIKIANGSALTVDVDVLVVSADYSIRHMMYDRFNPGDGVESPVFRLAPDNFGARRIIVVAREMRRHMDRTDLRFLEQMGMQTRAAAATGPRSLQDLLGDIATAPTRRSVVALNARANTDLSGSIQILRLDLTPPE